MDRYYNFFKSLNTETIDNIEKFIGFNELFKLPSDNESNVDSFNYLLNHFYDEYFEELFNIIRYFPKRVPLYKSSLDLIINSNDLHYNKIAYNFYDKEFLFSDVILLTYYYFSYSKYNHLKEKGEGKHLLNLSNLKYNSKSIATKYFKNKTFSINNYFRENDILLFDYCKFSKRKNCNYKNNCKDIQCKSCVGDFMANLVLKIMVNYNFSIWHQDNELYYTPKYLSKYSFNDTNICNGNKYCELFYYEMLTSANLTCNIYNMLIGNKYDIEEKIRLYGKEIIPFISSLPNFNGRISMFNDLILQFDKVKIDYDLNNISIELNNIYTYIVSKFINLFEHLLPEKDLEIIYDNFLNYLEKVLDSLNLTNFSIINSYRNVEINRDDYFYIFNNVNRNKINLCDDYLKNNKMYFWR